MNLMVPSHISNNGDSWFTSLQLAEENLMFEYYFITKLRARMRNVSHDISSNAPPTKEQLASCNVWTGFFG
jgi:hypothetical protein